MAGELLVYQKKSWCQTDGFPEFGNPVVFREIVWEKGKIKKQLSELLFYLVYGAQERT